MIQYRDVQWNQNTKYIDNREDNRTLLISEFDRMQLVYYINVPLERWNASDKIDDFFVINSLVVSIHPDENKKLVSNETFALVKEYDCDRPQFEHVKYALELRTKRSLEIISFAFLALARSGTFRDLTGLSGTYTSSECVKRLDSEHYAPGRWDPAGRLKTACVAK